MIFAFLCVKNMHYYVDKYQYPQSDKGLDPN
jgi:hypothetical protein